MANTQVPKWSSHFGHFQKHFSFGPPKGGVATFASICALFDRSCMISIELRLVHVSFVKFRVGIDDCCSFGSFFLSFFLSLSLRLCCARAPYVGKNQEIWDLCLLCEGTERVESSTEAS